MQWRRAESARTVGFSDALCHVAHCRRLTHCPFVIVVVPAFERKFKGQKIPIEELYEAYFDGKLDVIGGDESLLDTLYQRHQYARSILTASHVKFFLLQFIPELIKHTRFQDITSVGQCTEERRIDSSAPGRSSAPVRGSVSSSARADFSRFLICFVCISR